MIPVFLNVFGGGADCYVPDFFGGQGPEYNLSSCRYHPGRDLCRHGLKKDGCYKAGYDVGPFHPI